MELKELMKKKIGFISLGCDKNRVDLEEIMAKINDFGLEITTVENADIVVINTCAFILPARKEAIENILEMIELKKAGKIEKIVVTGCLSQRYLDELKEHLPEVDRFVRVSENSKIIEIICELYKTKNTQKIKVTKNQLALAPSHYAYLKIADGCNNGCAYCTIPRIRGRYKSVPFEEVIERAKELVRSGAKELIIVAQDVTRYGCDLYKSFKLAELLNEISKIKNLEWIRIHYAYPELMTDELLKVISTNKKICPYIDIPLQHIDQKILKDMNRRSGEKEIRALISNIKTNYPSISIRSTFIVGFPGETSKQFKKLCIFLQEAQLENVGFFAFSREEGTKAFYMKRQVYEFVKKRRLKKIETIQEKISNKNNLLKIGNTEKVIVDGFNEQTGFFEARTSKMSPNVDFYINLEDNGNIKVGEFYNVQLIAYKEYAFVAKIVG